jgi:hypothetical protein
MTHTVIGFFADSTAAGEAVGDLKSKGYTKEISVLAHDKSTEGGDMHEVKKDAAVGAAVGTAVGAVTGALAGLFSGITALAVPGIGILIGGPLAMALGLTGGAAGALTGGLAGALIDWGINAPTAKLYEQRIMRGEVLVGVSVPEERTGSVRSVLEAHGADEVNTVTR